MFQLLNLPISRTEPPKNKGTKRKVLATKISRLNARIKRKQKNSTYRRKGGLRVRNFFRLSYFAKYILRKRADYKRTIYSPYYEKINYKIIDKGFKLIRISVLKNPYNKRLQILRRKGKIRPIRPYRLGLITVRKKRRNLFATIHKLLDRNMKIDLFQKKNIKKKPRLLTNMETPYKYEVSFKSSVGLTGYKGPKRRTYLGTKRVGKACAFFLRKNRYTGYDLRFSREFTKKYNFFIKGLTQSRFWVRRIIIPRRHSHGFTRGKKPRR